MSDKVYILKIYTDVNYARPNIKWYNNYFFVSIILSVDMRRMFDNGVSKRLFGRKKDEVAVIWGQFHNEFRTLNSSPDIIRVINSRRTR
jgi:hypothetical protein